MGKQHDSEYEDRIRALLGAIRRGDRAAFDTLIEAIGQDMRKLSAHFLRNGPPAGTLQTTALVNEAVLRLVQMLNREARKFPETKEHLMALLCQMMRFTLTDYARKRRFDFVSLNEPLRGDEGEVGDSSLADVLRDWSEQDLDGLLAIDQALDAIARADPEYGQRRRAAIELHLFSGMNYREIADHLGVTDDMARRDCQIALGRLREILGDRPPTVAPVGV